LLDWSVIASMATATGTLALAIATFFSIRSANHAARVAERTLLVGLRPVLMPSRAEDRAEDVLFGDDHSLSVRGGLAVVEQVGGRYYLAISLRNVGAGLAVLRGWHVSDGRERFDHDHVDVEAARRQQRDLYVGAGDIGYWQGAVRDADDPFLPIVRQSVAAGTPLTVDLVYGDHEGGQRTVSRFVLYAREGGGTEWRSEVTRHWHLEGPSPR
jgi:hypothetical protein